ncbi:MAG: Hsp20/alpha crystallin family protein [Desulfobacteraceae bacterium]|nr:Hsp20/alpha crystallin family protein [Desulfobacteraceae bacterium]
MIYRRWLQWPQWQLHSPYDEMDRLRRRLEELYENYAGDQAGRSSSGVFPLVNLTEDAENFYLRAELPGVASEDLDIQATGKSITLSGERKIPVEEGARYHRKERDAGKFSRGLNLPSDIDADKVTAKVMNGILNITIPKAESVKPRKIAIN